MVWVNLVTLLALLEFFTFGALVGKARRQYGIRAPAISGNPVFERYFRVQQNTLECLIIFIPALWISAQYWEPAIVAGIGGVVLVGRIWYFRSYVRDPTTRGIGFLLSMGPTLLLVLAGLAGIGRSLLNS